MSSEKSFQTAVVKFLRQHDAVVFNTVGNVYQSGFPDLYVAHRDWTGWMELKVGKGKVTEQQKHNLIELRRRGVNSNVVRKTDLGTVILANPDETWTMSFESFKEAWSHLCQK